jgi:hypothetical protein
MNDLYFYKPDRYILNHCTKYLARFNTDRRHPYGPDPVPRDNVAEAWRFPVVDTYAGGISALADPTTWDQYNEVTFIYAGTDTQTPKSVNVVGTFDTLHTPLPLKQTMFEGEPTRYWSLTFAVPKGEMHRYRFVVDGAAPINDPINPQQMTLDNKVVWSRFITEAFTGPLVFERWELDLLDRLSTEILPFQTPDATNFLSRFYNYLDSAKKKSAYNNVFRMDSSVGEVNFIDNILAREEWHRLADYRICLRMVDKILRSRDPYVDPCKMDTQTYQDLYNEMATGSVAGWDTSLYSSPSYFLTILRRHMVMGAFSHPKYGGNVGASGWAFLSERYKDAAGNTLFNWGRALEPGLGTNQDYLG